MSTWWAPRSSKPLSVSDPYRGWFDSFPLRHYFPASSVPEKSEKRGTETCSSNCDRGEQYRWNCRGHSDYLKQGSVALAQCLWRYHLCCDPNHEEIDHSCYSDGGQNCCRECSFRVLDFLGYLAHVFEPNENEKGQHGRFENCRHPDCFAFASCGRGFRNGGRSHLSQENSSCDQDKE